MPHANHAPVVPMRHHPDVLKVESGRAAPFSRPLAWTWWGVAAVVLLIWAPPRDGRAADGLSIAWTNNILTVTGAGLPGERIETWYLEAFCRSGSTHREWQHTTIPHQTELLQADPAGRWLRLRTRVEPSVEVSHEIRAGQDEVTFELEVINRGGAYSDVQWFQPCLRVDRFTGREQSNYWQRCFIFTKDGFRMLGQTVRTEEALYRGGQVYVPAGIDLNDVNPRPLSPDRPVHGLIGCISADDRWLLATAWDQTQELFQGVIVCIHNDPRVGGLKPGERKHLRGKLYVVPNDPAALQRRYEKDFGGKK